MQKPILLAPTCSLPPFFHKTSAYYITSLPKNIIPAETIKKWPATCQNLFNVTLRVHFKDFTYTPPHFLRFRLESIFSTKLTLKRTLSLHRLCPQKDTYRAWSIIVIFSPLSTPVKFQWLVNTSCKIEVYVHNKSLTGYNKKDIFVYV